MTAELAITIAQAVALVAIACVLAFRRLPQGPPGPAGLRGERGERGEPGERGAPGHITVSRHEAVLAGTRCEMLRGGKPTGHYLFEGTSDFEEAINTPGLSVLFPDGHIEEGIQT